MITGPCQAFFVVVHPRLPPGVDSYRNPTGGAQGAGCFVCIRDKPAYFPETFETEWYVDNAGATLSMVVLGIRPLIHLYFRLNGKQRNYLAISIADMSS